MEIKHLGLKSYISVWEEMKSFTSKRDANTPDELWMVEHPAVYTQGQAGKAEHVINPQKIPIVQSDRGGQVTYHGPGQLVAYVLFDIRRRNIGVRSLVTKLENLLIELLAYYQILGKVQCGAPGVYVNEKKIASIGLRVKNGCTYHGIALNVNMDLDPFLGINPCGFAKLEMTQVADFFPSITMKAIIDQWTDIFISHFEH